MYGTALLDSYGRVFLNADGSRRLDADGTFPCLPACILVSITGWNPCADCLAGVGGAGWGHLDGTLNGTWAVPLVPYTSDEGPGETCRWRVTTGINLVFHSNDTCTDPDLSAPVIIEIRRLSNTVMSLWAYIDNNPPLHIPGLYLFRGWLDGTAPCEFATATITADFAGPCADGATTHTGSGIALDIGYGGTAVLTPNACTAGAGFESLSLDALEAMDLTTFEGLGL